MSEDLGNIEADLEALVAALELAGTMAERARQDAQRLARFVRKDPPRSREEWADRARLRSPDGQDLGWLDTSTARRIDLSDGTGAGDRHVLELRRSEPEDGTEGPGKLVEVEGQFFEVRPGQGASEPEQARPITREDAQARIAEHRPDLRTRMVGDDAAQLEISRPARSEGRPRGMAPAEAGRAVDAESTGPRPAAAAWDEPEAAPQAAGGGRSAAEEFGADPSEGQRGRSAEAPEAPSTAELTAVGATKPVATHVSR